jgi:hypothetical protein
VTIELNERKKSNNDSSTLWCDPPSLSSNSTIPPLPTTCTIYEAQVLDRYNYESTHYQLCSNDQMFQREINEWETFVSNELSNS